MKGQRWIGAIVGLGMLLLAVRAYAKEGMSLLTPKEAEALRAALPKIPQVPPELLQATDEELWDYVPPASLRRAVFLSSFEAGCPVHGKEIYRVGGGFYPWRYSGDKPWQVQCPVGGETYPSNDFGAFLKSGMKDRSLLTGPYPDDGTGWTDDKGQRYFFVGYWVFHQRWRDVLRGITGFAEAYLATGKEEYAHKATVLFCALAEQYPHMDYPHQGTQGENCGGMILPWCWENNEVVIPLSTAYDRLFPYLQKEGDPELRAFLQTKTDLGPRKQIEQRFMQTVAKTMLTTDNYWSNEGDHQLAFAIWALAWDNNNPAEGVTTQQALDWILHEGGDNTLEELILNCTYRDGFPCEGAIGYSADIARRLVEIAEQFKRCGYNLYKEYPRLKQIAGCWIDMTLADGHVPSIGDAGSVQGLLRPWNARMFHLAWENYKDPKFVQALTELKSYRAAPYAPDRAAEFAAIIKQYGMKRPHHTRNLGGMGLAILESGGELHPRGVAMYYGCPAGGHCHHDRLNIEFFAYRQSVMPDLGYPDQWGAKAQQFTSNSIGHYSVLVDEQGETDYMAGYLDFLQGLPGVQIASAHAERCFPGTSLYRRETALIDLSSEHSYVFDVFRVRGGGQHDWSFHLPPVPEWGLEGAELSPPANGTLAGPDIPEGGAYSQDNGFNWLVRPQFGKPKGNFTFYAKAHPPYPQLRMTMLAGCADDIIVADHETPRIKAALPPYMKWLLARRRGEKPLSSAFAAVIEACPDTPQIQHIQRLAPRGGTEPVAALIRSAAATDMLISDETGEKPLRLPSGEMFQGRWGMIRRDTRGVREAVFIGGRLWQDKQLTVETIPAWTGQITGVDYQKNCLTVNTSLPPGEALRGEWMIIYRGAHRTCYEIASVTPLAQGSRVQLTEISPLVGKGYIERLEEDKHLIHTDTRWRIWGKDYIWSHDFGPALQGYVLYNEDLSQGVEIESCQLMPSRARQWWKPDPAWIKIISPEKAWASYFRDSNGDGRIGYWIYDFGPGFSFRITNSVMLRRLSPQHWFVEQHGGPLRLRLPAAIPLKQILLRDGRGRALILPCRYEARTKQAEFAVPGGLPGTLAIALRSPAGLNLSDSEPPVVKKITVNGRAVSPEEFSQLSLSTPLQKIEVAVADAGNPLDLQATHVVFGGRRIYPGEPGVGLQLDKAQPRQGVLRIMPGSFMDLAAHAEGRLYSLDIWLYDAALSGGGTKLSGRFQISPPMPPGTVYLSDLTPTKVFAHGGLKRDEAYLGGPLYLGGIHYPKGLMLCPEKTEGPRDFGEAIFRLPPGKFKRFRAVIGICDDTEAGSVIFAVQLRQGGGEWQEVFRSGLMQRSSPPQAISVPLGDADEIRLYTDAYEDINCDHAVFASARLEP